MVKSFKILVTGVPGSGKTTFSNELSKMLNLKVISDKDLLTEDMYQKIYTDGYFVNDVDIKKFEKVALEISQGVFEGILFPETKMKFDFAIVLVTKQDVLRERLKQRGYNDVKIEDNVFSQNSKYLERLAKRKSNKIIVIESDTLDKDLNLAIMFINSK